MNYAIIPVSCLILATIAVPRSSAAGDTDESPLQAAAERVAEGLRQGTVPPHTYKEELAWEALLRWSEAAGREEWSDWVVTSARERGLRPDSRSARNRSPFNCLIWWLHEHDGDDAWLEPFIEQTRAYRKEVSRSPEGAIQHGRGEKRGGGDAILIDALQDYASRMAMLGVATGDETAFEEAVAQYRIHRDIVRDPESGLWRQGRGWGDDPDELSPGHWSRGHGWLILGMVDTLLILPEDSEAFAEMRTYLEEVADALVAVQQPSGMWHCLMNRPPDQSPPEASGTGLIAGNIGIALGHGFLEGEKYEQAARKAFAALPAYVRDDGVVESVSPGPGPLSEEEPWMVESFEPGDPHGPFGILFAALGELEMR